MRTVALASTVCVSLAVGACGSTPSKGTGSTAADSHPAKDGDTSGDKTSRRQFELASGTVVAVRITRALSTVRDRARDTFDATLDDPVLANDVEVLPRGTRFSGHVTTSEASGHLEGRAVLGLTLDAFEIKGERYPVTTSVNTRASEGHKKRNVTAIGGGAGLGALIGGIAGGGKGAAIGAAVGAGAGTGAAAATGKLNVEIPAETRFRFTLKQAVTIAD